MNNSPRIMRRARRGFTIAEIIVVVIIIGVLATIVATRLLPRIGQSKATVAAANANALASAIDQYRLDCGDPPAGTPASQFLFQKPTDPLLAEKWSGPYLKNTDGLKDPWGREFIVKFPGEKNTADFDVISYGADGQPGGEGENKDIIKP